MNRKERRAAGHLERKQARKAGFPVAEQAPVNPEPQPQTASAVAAEAVTNIPEPGDPLPSLAEITPKIHLPDHRAQVNRANAQHSTGPVTPAGLTISSQNRTVHGMARHNGAFKLLASEDPLGFEALQQTLADEHQPATETESILINTMAESHWLANRAANLQASCFDAATGHITDSKFFSLYLRYQTTHSRAFHKSLNDLLKLRAECRKAEIGFEAQNRKDEEIRIKNEKHEMKKQTHYWDVLRKDSEACARLSQTIVQRTNLAKENPGFEAQFAAELEKRGLKNGAFGVAASAAA
jgi:hypothetical protein